MQIMFTALILEKKEASKAFKRHLLMCLPVGCVDGDAINGIAACSAIECSGIAACSAIECLVRPRCCCSTSLKFQIRCLWAVGWCSTIYEKKRRAVGWCSKKKRKSALELRVGCVL